MKSLAGCSVTSAEVDELGIVGDRRFMVVDEDGRFLTQRTLPQMALVRTALSPDFLTLSQPGAGEIAVGRHSEPAAPLRNVTVWKSAGLLAEDCGDNAAGWLSDALRVRCRLVRIGEKFLRPVLNDIAGPGDRVHFGDAYPFLVMSEASVADLNRRLAEAGEPTVPMDRFRPNLVVRGGEAFVEDTWTRFRIGNVTIRAAGGCARCAITTTDQQTACRGPEPLRTLATYRRDPKNPNNVNFGQNLIHETKSGRLQVGDSVDLLA